MFSNSKPFRRRKSSTIRSGIERLEERRLLSAGGGWTAGGLSGNYFANPDLTGPAAFSRSDVRLDFDWGTLHKPGGSISPGFRDVGSDGFSARWTGQLKARFSERYTFRALSDDAFKLEIRPAGGAWTTVIDQQTATDGGTTGQFDLEAGAAHDVRIEFREYTGAAQARLMWSSPSTPEEVIDPATELGFNVDFTWGQAFTDIVRSARNNFEGVDGRPRPPQDASGWPMGNGAFVWQESLNQGLGLDPMTRGKITFSFRGRADISLWGNVDLASLTSSYDPASNRTVGSFVATDRNINASFFYFRNTDRDGDFGADGLPDNDGLTDLSLMKPSSPGAATSFAGDTLFQPQVKEAMSHFTSLRVDLNNQNQESAWSDRTLPDYFNQRNGKPAPRIYSTGELIGSGPSWEHKVMLANETGRDLYINIPMAATGWTPADVDSYVYKLAQLIRYGSDGVNPYTSPQADPAYPPLNPNLNVYVELSNEYWNAAGDAFRQYWDLDAMVKADADAALNGGVHPTGDPRARPGDFAIFNHDSLPATKNSSGQYNSIGTWRKRKMALRTVQISEIFREVFGDAAMPGTSASPRVRPLYMWQYENANTTASEALEFVSNYFNNADGQQHVAEPRPASHYLYGGGGATYYGSGNQWGVTGQLSDPSFEGPVVAAGYTEAPGGSAWSFQGSAGLARDAGTADDVVPAAAGAQVAYVAGLGSMGHTFTLPADQTSDLYAISFKAVQRTKAGTSTPDTQKLRVFIDNIPVNSRSFSQANGYQPVAWSASKGWVARVVNWTDSEYYQTLVFSGEPGSTHTVRFEGMAAADQAAFIDDVRLSSVDAIFAGGMPPSGNANRLRTQASWAMAYGLEYVAYEGGWALGGDTGGSPLQLRAKYGDPRAAMVNIASLHQFDQAGGTQSVLGTYAQWPTWSDAYAKEGLLDLSDNPLTQGQDGYLGNLPTDVTNGSIIGDAPLTLSPAQRALGLNFNNNRLNTGGWFAWNVIAPSAGPYNIAVDAAPGGTVQILVDGKVVDAFNSKDALTQGPATVQLSRGVHSLRVRAHTGSFDVPGVTVRAGIGAATGPALGLTEMAGMAYNEAQATPDSVASAVALSPLTNGPGLRPNTQGSFANGLLVSPLATGATPNRYAQTLDESIARNEYQSFTVSATDGRQLSLAALRINTFFQNNPSIRGVGLRYSLDGTNFVTAGAFTGTAADSPRFDLSGVPALQGASGTVTLRIHYFGGQNYSTVGTGNRPGNDLVLYGALAGANAAPTVAEPASANPAPVTGTSATLSVLGDDDAGEANLTYTWSVAAKPDGAADPVFSDNGTNLSKSAQVTFAKAGAYRLVATITDSGGRSVTSTVDVAVEQTLTSITLTPNPTTVSAGGTVAFAATGFDQFGEALAAPLSPAWSVTSGGGSISQAGLYTAPAAEGTATVQAQLNGIAGTAEVTIVIEAPGAPSNLVAAAVSSSRIDLTWSDNSDNETSFIIERATNATFTEGLVSASAPAEATSHSFTGLAAGTTYFFRVRAANAAGESASSGTAQATTHAGTPATPANLSASALSSTQIRLDWLDMSSNETGFQVEISSDRGITFQLIATPGSDATTYTVAGLAPKTQYHFRVRAFNAVGPSDYSNVASARTRPK